MGLDVGDVRIGVAMSDPMGIIATPKEVVDGRDEAKAVAALAELVKENEVVAIVAGMPLDRQGERGHQAKKVESFLASLSETTGMEILTQDERFTSAAAHRTLDATNVRAKNRKGKVDQLAAQQILQTYLDRRARENKA